MFWISILLLLILVALVTPLEQREEKVRSTVRSIFWGFIVIGMIMGGIAWVVSTHAEKEREQARREADPAVIAARSRDREREEKLKAMRDAQARQVAAIEQKYGPESKLREEAIAAQRRAEQIAEIERKYGTRDGSPSAKANSAQ